MYSFWARCIPDCGGGAQERFKESFELFFEAVNIQTRAREKGVIPDLESYIDIRRDTSGKACQSNYRAFRAVILRVLMILSRV